MENLRQKLDKEGLVNITFLIVNHHDQKSRNQYSTLKRSVSEFIKVYDQEINQKDVWKTLSGTKDDFLIYDRCGRLTYHLGLPYSLLNFPYVEDSIRRTYCNGLCGNCSLQTNETTEGCKKSDIKIEKNNEDHITNNSKEARHHHHHHHHHHNHSKPSGHNQHHRHTDHHMQTHTNEEGMSQQQAMDLSLPLEKP
ncbi:SEPP1 protein, partial [Polypterus senegalus]